MSAAKSGPAPDPSRYGTRSLHYLMLTAPEHINWLPTGRGVSKTDIATQETGATALELAGAGVSSHIHRIGSFLPKQWPTICSRSALKLRR